MSCLDQFVLNCDVPAPIYGLGHFPRLSTTLCHVHRCSSAQSFVDQVEASNRGLKLDGVSQGRWSFPFDSELLTNI